VFIWFIMYGIIAFLFGEYERPLLSEMLLTSQMSMIVQQLLSFWNSLYVQIPQMEPWQ